MSTFIRALAFLVVLAVAGIAFWISFEHIVHVARAYGEGGAIAYAYSGVIDGPLIAASLSMWDAARRGARAPSLAWWVLGAGIAVSLTVNVDAGAQHGIGGALVAVWPSIALVGSFELLMQMARAGHVPASASTTKAVSGPASTGVLPDVPAIVPVAVPTIVPVDVSASTPYPAPVVSVQAVSERAPRRAHAGKPKPVERLFAAEISRGELPSIREVKRRAQCGTPRATAIRDQLAQLLEAQPEAA